MYCSHMRIASFWDSFSVTASQVLSLLGLNGSEKHPPQNSNTKTVGSQLQGPNTRNLVAHFELSYAVNKNVTNYITEGKNYARPHAFMV